MAWFFWGRTYRSPDRQRAGRHGGGAGATFVAGPIDVMPLPDYFLDKFEVTNRQFKQFVDAGGYRDSKYWRQRFRKDGRDISFAGAVTLLRDTTGRPGPSAWELGAFPKEQGGLSRLRRELV